ncbi:MAG TPA: IS4 family transposase [Mucilaginibacter sp.]|jgi:hypothetical protein
MTPNHSLDLSLQLQNLIRTDLLQQISMEFPFRLIESNNNKEGTKKRDRVFNDGNTLLTMLVTAVNEDKSLKQSVNIFKEIFESRGEHIVQREREELENKRQMDNTIDKRMGRPKLYQSQLPKSKTQPVSDNTAAYTKARQRLGYSLVQQVFDYSKDFTGIEQSLWHGMKTYNTDGTYCQMQDSEELRKKYYVKEGDGAYPQLLLQGIVQQGSGQIVSFEVGTRHQSELELIAKQIGQLSEDSLLLADDLYNSYAIFAMIQQQGCHLIVPGKRDRAYKIIEKIADGDEIVELSRGDIPKWWQRDWELPKKLLMRRITFLSPADGKTEWVQYTTLLDKQINKADITAKYISRWDIEITIRETKTLMDINIIRSKSEDMVFKEITIALTAYNMMRKIIAKSVEKTDLSPQENIIQEFFEANKTILIDKKGRIYNRWSPGRYGQTA